MSGISPVTGLGNGLGSLSEVMVTAASGMRAQTQRLRSVAENLANANSTAATPGGTPYQRKMTTFEEAIDKATGAPIVKAGSVVLDQTPFRKVYDPSHPAAGSDGYVQMPNVSEVIEAADMREAERSYEANLATLTQARSMFSKTLDILKV
jgi:flagellar basal-body rod protein FlgC